MDITQTLKASEEGIWVDWKDGVSVKLRMSPELLQKIRKTCTKKIMDKGVIREELDAEHFDEMLNEQVILDWKGITNEGKPFPCTPENKALLMKKSVAFSTFINQACLELENVKESELKN
jgi:hypothetical protein